MTNSPLKNKRIVITRDKKQSKTLIDSLSGLGAHVMAFPSIKIVEPENWDSCDAALDRIDEYDWIIFSSGNGVRFFLDRLVSKGIISIKARIATVGKKTLKELEKFGFTASLVPETFNANGLLKTLRPHEMQGKKILIPTSDIARSELRTGLVKMNAEVDQVVVYHTIPNFEIDTAKLTRYLEEGKIDCLTFFSPSSFRYLVKLLGERVLDYIRSSSITVAAIGPTTARALQNKGVDPAIVPEESTDEGMITAILEYYQIPTE